MLYTGSESYCVFIRNQEITVSYIRSETIVLYAELDKTLGLYTKIR